MKSLNSYLRGAIARKIARVGACLCATLCLAGCGANSDYESAEGAVWNTSYHITYDGAAELKDSILTVLRDVERSVSVFDDNSLISRINRNETDSIDIHLHELLRASKTVNAACGGAFDPTIGPLIDAWGFGKGHEVNADTAAIAEILTYTGLQRVSFGAGRIRKPDPRMQFNLSAIAKGYGADMVGAMFRRNGVENYLVEIGGEIAASGEAPHGRKWSVAIDAPVEERGRGAAKAQEIIEIGKCGVATSGNYRNFHHLNGTTLGHTINPATGRPVATDVASATVVTSSAMLADAYATACMVIGSEEVRRLANHHNLAIFIIKSDSTTWASPQFERLIRR